MDKQQLLKDKTFSEGLELLVKDYNISMEEDYAAYFIDRIAEWLSKKTWFKPFHFTKTCEYLVTHWTEYRTVNVAVFKTAFIRVNQKD